MTQQVSKSGVYLPPENSYNFSHFGGQPPPAPSISATVVYTVSLTENKFSRKFPKNPKKILICVSNSCNPFKALYTLHPMVQCFGPSFDKMLFSRKIPLKSQRVLENISKFVHPFSVRSYTPWLKFKTVQNLMKK